MLDMPGGEEASYYLLLRVFQVAAVVFVTSGFMTGSPYGSQSAYSGALAVDGRLGWIVMELVSPAALLCSYLASSTAGPQAQYSAVTHVMCGLWVLHYTNRALVYPLRQASRKPMHIGVVLASCMFNTVNGYLNGRWLSVFSNGLYTNAYWDVYQGRALLGLSLFVLGMAGNIYHDNVLMNLRQPGAQPAPGSARKYLVPCGGLFALVSCPHYFCEVVEWAGFAVLTQSPAAWAFVFGAAGNLLPRAYQIHKWYQREFPGYPANRKAMIPYVI
ncbi:hypothetical protein EV174_002942 [Coemansia sp. RSA 2320]|nr:hypothetical protein EV174_002942 [Coemansia sp. RSA 2320]